MRRPLSLKTLLGFLALFLFIEVHGSDIISIHEFMLTKTIHRSALVEARVAHVYRCPPCPPRAMCKPCDVDHVVLKDLTTPDTLKAQVRAGSTFYQQVKDGQLIQIHLLRKENSEIYALPAASPGESYYQTLRQKCEKVGSESCCLSSLQRMQMLEVSETPDTGCPPYATRDMLKCKDSFKWCY